MPQMVENLPAKQETQVQSPGQEASLEKEMVITPVFLPREFHRHRSWAAYSPWACKELDTTEKLIHLKIYSIKCITKPNTLAKIQDQVFIISQKEL